MKYREAARKFEKLGCKEHPRRAGGSHRKWLNPATDRATVLPDWGAKDPRDLFEVIKRVLSRSPTD